MDNHELISTLNDLIGCSKDGQKGFTNAAEHAHAESMKTLFSKYASRCGSGAAELQALVISLGGDAKEDGSVGGALRRGFTQIKAAISSDTDHAILEECEKGEDVAKKMYSDALKKDLPVAAREIITRQNMEVIEHHDTIRDLRDGLRKSPDMRSM